MKHFGFFLTIFFLFAGGLVYGEEAVSVPSSDASSAAAQAAKDTAVPPASSSAVLAYTLVGVPISVTAPPSVVE